MTRLPTLAFLSMLAAASTVARAQSPDPYMTEQNRMMARTMASRSVDWRNGPIVYQVFVDRFVPPANLNAKRHLYAPPRLLREWTDVPKPGHQDREHGVWTHELDFWGGDLKGVETKLDYVRSLGADVLYLNPIQSALTNHKYDAMDWADVAPEYGTRQDVLDIAHMLHGKGMKLMLDGVFNHMGLASPRFQDALKNPQSPYRNWFFIDPKYPRGYRTWANTGNLVEVRLEDRGLRDYLWEGHDSVVQKYLRDGVDGWRLDTAFELGPKYLSDLTKAAHRARADSAVVGEVWNYPQGWSPALDGVMNFFARRVVLDSIAGKTAPSIANRLLERMVDDCGIKHLLKSWLVLDNHDTDRLRSILPDVKERHLAQVMQFTLPGAPVLYYGVEVGMEGKGDPGSRGPMRWDLVSDDNPETAWLKRIVGLRKSSRALRIGDYAALDCSRLIGFSRRTDKALESVFVFANPSNETVHETVSCRDGMLMNGGQLKDMLDGALFTAYSGIIEIAVPAKSARVLEMVQPRGYTPYKRVH
ncbi:MAG: alpha-amylase family glycosyl hydrolase [Fimbriimonas sp.]|nr:alpha-amylase family glycosyl hydrolase [Fimbriimonas sp.]